MSGGSTRCAFHRRITSIVVLVSLYQLLGVARAMEDLHRTNVVYGNLKIVRDFPSPHFCGALTFVQTNLLVDAGGHIRIAGLGAASIPFTPAVDVDRFFYGAAPELVDPQRFQSTDAGVTTASDMYAFGVLAWEVSGYIQIPLDKFSGGVGPGLRRTGSIPGPDQGCRGVLNVEGAPTR